MTAPSVPPPPTAPARLTRVTRERKVTQKVKDARAAGLAARTAAPGVTAQHNIKVLYTGIGASEVKWLCL